MLKLLHNSLQRMSLTQTSSLSSELFFHVAPCCYFIITFLSHASSTAKGMAVSVISPLESRLKYLSNKYLNLQTEDRKQRLPWSPNDDTLTLAIFPLFYSLWSLPQIYCDFDFIYFLAAEVMVWTKNYSSSFLVSFVACHL